MKSSEVITNKYREEIDGIRAFAVIAVIINHINKDFLQSGYLGVDIFFVISGYVITSSLTRRTSNNFSNFIVGFYERRIKRLLPALIFYILIITFLICTLNPHSGNTLWTGFFSLFGISNYRLLLWEADYFALENQFNVFLQTWSLAIEEQFYFLFPFLVWFSGFGQKSLKGARNLFIIVFSLSSFSLIYFIYLYPINKSSAYFLMPARFWEIGVGVIAFLIVYKKWLFSDFIISSRASITLALITSILFLPLSSAIFAKVSIVFFTALLICSIKKNTFVYKLFTIKYLVFIGRISYSLYLWHWGVLSISRWTIGIHWWSIPFQIFLMVGLATLSFKFIESPLREAKSNNKISTLIKGFMSICLTSLFIVIIGGPLHGKIFLAKYPIEDFKKVFFYNNYDTGDDLEAHIENDISKAIYIIGDSHGLQLYPSLKTVSKDFGFEKVFFTRNVKGLENISNNDLIFFSHSYKNGKINMKMISDVLDIAKREKTKLVFVDDLPQFGINGDSDFYPKFSFFRNGPTISREKAEESRKDYTEILMSYVNNYDTFYLDPLTKLCNDDICPAVLNDNLIYADSSPHFTLKGSMLLKDLWLENISIFLRTNANHLKN